MHYHMLVMGSEDCLVGDRSVAVGSNKETKYMLFMVLGSCSAYVSAKVSFDQPSFEV